jgi:hypothetical protein
MCFACWITKATGIHSEHVTPIGFTRQQWLRERSSMLRCTEWSKSLCTWWLQYRKLQVMFKVSPASLQTFIHTRLTLTPSVIPNSNYVIMVSDWNCLKYFCLFLYCNHQVHREFLITLYIHSPSCQCLDSPETFIVTSRQLQACYSIN